MSVQTAVSGRRRAVTKETNWCQARLADHASGTDAKESPKMKVLLALSAFTAASADVAFRWPDSAATTLAALLFGPLVFAIVWLTVRVPRAQDEGDEGARAE
jgi:hypothetical protein